MPYTLGIWKGNNSPNLSYEDIQDLFKHARTISIVPCKEIRDYIKVLTIIYPSDLVEDPHSCV